jgi:hypothetical protein
MKPIARRCPVRIRLLASPPRADQTSSRARRHPGALSSRLPSQRLGRNRAQPPDRALVVSTMRAKRLVVVSDDVAAELRRHFPQMAPVVSVIPNGVDTGALPVPPAGTPLETPTAGGRDRRAPRGVRCGGTGGSFADFDLQSKP